MIGASDEQLDVFNEVWYTMLLNSGEAIEGKNLKSLIWCSNLTVIDYVKLNTAIEVIEKRIEKREGIPFLWRLLVHLLFIAHGFFRAQVSPDLVNQS